MAGLDLSKMYQVSLIKPEPHETFGTWDTNVGSIKGVRHAQSMNAQETERQWQNINMLQNMTDIYNARVGQMASDIEDVSGKADTLWDNLMGDLTGGDYTQYLQTESSKAITDPLKEAVGIADTQQGKAEDWLTQIVGDYEGLLPEAKRQALAGVLSTQIDQGALGRAEGSVASAFAGQRDAARRQAASMGLSAGQMAGLDRRAGLTQAAEQAAAREKARVAETARAEEAKKFNYEAVAKLAGMGEEMQKAGMGQVASAAEQAGSARKDLSSGTESLIQIQQNLLGEQLDAAKYLTGLASESQAALDKYSKEEKPPSISQFSQVGGYKNLAYTQPKSMDDSNSYRFAK